MALQAYGHPNHVALAAAGALGAAGGYGGPMWLAALQTLASQPPATQSHDAGSAPLARRREEQRAGRRRREAGWEEDEDEEAAVAPQRARRLTATTSAAQLAAWTPGWAATGAAACSAPSAPALSLLHPLANYTGRTDPCSR